LETALTHKPRDNSSHGLGRAAPLLRYQKVSRSASGLHARANTRFRATPTSHATLAGFGQPPGRTPGGFFGHSPSHDEPGRCSGGAGFRHIAAYPRPVGSFLRSRSRDLAAFDGLPDRPRTLARDSRARTFAQRLSD
jgi:hypothetical protein